MTTDDTSAFAAEPNESGADEQPTTDPDAERDDWRGPQDDPWQPEEQAPPPVIGE